MRFHIHITHHFPVIEEKLEEHSKLLVTIIQKTNQIMATIQELNDKVTELQAAVDAEQEQIAALLATNAQVVTDLNTQIAALQDALSAAPTPEAIQGVIDGLNTIKADVESTV